MSNENEAPGEDVPAAVHSSHTDDPLTQEEYATQIQRLTERARAAGLKPVQIMTRTYAKLVMDGLESLVASLEGDSSPKKKKE